MACSEKFEKLPTFCKPQHYRIRLSPDLDKFLAKGHVDISLTFSERSKYVKLHAALHEFQSASLKLENGKELTNLKFELDKKWKTVSLQFPTEIEPQKAVLSIDFVTEISTHLFGFYRSEYKDSAGNSKMLASTQFESDSARLAFPCWDEPVYKATFDVELEVNDKLTALSNMNIISEAPSAPNKKLVKYATTPIMSSYLVAFIVGEFDYIETKYGEKQIPIRLYTVPGKQEMGRFCLDVAKKSMEWYEKWFDFKSPLPKVDLIAIPNFSMGAMENWGLVTYREQALLLDEHATHYRRSRCALTTAHELGHFWFGNLTTMSWWCDLWLKEGFASFMEYLAVEALYPELKTSLDYLSDVVADSLHMDGKRSSHKIEVEINDPKELNSIYDAITYEKSNSIIRMLCYYLGEDVFREGLRLYIKRFQYANAVTTDLWQAFSDVSKHDINKLMTSWTQQIGYPLVSVEESRLPGGKRRLKLTQTRYLADGTTDNTLWQIPITLITSTHVDKPFQRFLMTEREKEIVLDGIGDDEWVKLNAQTTGFYRVKYHGEMLTHLLNAVHSGKLTLPDRYGLANDMFALVNAGHISASQFLSFFAALENENEYLVWQSIISGIQAFANVLDRHNPELKKHLDKFVSSILEPVASRLGWEVKKGEDAHRSQLRSLILSTLSKANHSGTIEKALKLFDSYIGGDTSAIHPELRNMIFATVARKHAKGFEQLLKLYETSDIGDVKRSVLLTIAQVPSKENREKIFSYAVYESKVKSQDLYYVFAGAQADPQGQDYIWTWFQKHYKKLIDIYGGPSDSLFLHSYGFSGRSQSSESFAKEYEAFYKSEFDEDAQKANERTHHQTLESVRLSAKLFENNEASIKEFLSSH